MTYTGHRETRIHTRELVDFITPAVEDESRYYGVSMPTKKQMALVISALRNHTIIMHAANYDRSELGSPDKLSEYMPTETSIGRYFRDAAEQTLRKE